MPSMAPMNRMQVALRMRADDRKSCGVLLSQMDAVALRMRADDGQSLNFPNSTGLVSPCCERGGLPMGGEALEYSRKRCNGPASGTRIRWLTCEGIEASWTTG